jgi:hypothetical protein
MTILHDKKGSYYHWKRESYNIKQWKTKAKLLINHYNNLSRGNWSPQRTMLLKVNCDYWSYSTREMAAYILGYDRYYYNKPVY